MKKSKVMKEEENVMSQQLTIDKKEVTKAGSGNVMQRHAGDYPLTICIQITDNRDTVEWWNLTRFHHTRKAIHHIQVQTKDG